MNIIWNIIKRSAFPLAVYFFTTDEEFFTRKARSVAVGTALLLSSLTIALVSIVFLLLSLFFALADLSQYTSPTLITGIVGIALALMLGLEGKHRMWMRNGKTVMRR